MHQYNKRSEQIFRLLVNNYRDKVIRFISLFVQDDCACEELASDVFISLWSNWQKIPEIAHIDNYIFIIAKNKALNHLRKEQKESVDIDSMITDSFHHTETTPESIYISKEIAAELNRAVNDLPQKTKLAFLLVRENKKTYKEAAEILGVSVKTIEKQVACAVERLKERLGRF
jgi:RNA polymerase sigma-70 factor (ECF subfamily)